MANTIEFIAEQQKRIRRSIRKEQTLADSGERVQSAHFRGPCGWRRVCVGRGVKRRASPIGLNPGQPAPRRGDAHIELNL